MASDTSVNAEWSSVLDSYTRRVFLSTGRRVFVVVLNYQHAGDTARCVTSLRRSGDRDLHLVVVDNHSEENTLLRESLGQTVPIITSGANLGYAAGNNLGITHALACDADYIWVLNPDTEIEPKTLQLLLATMDTHPEAGCVGSVNLVGGSEPPQVQFAGGRIDWEAGAVTESLGIGRPLSSITATEPYPVDYVAGTSMLIRRPVFEDVGLLPEEYFLYFEETDFQMYAHSHGWLSFVNPLARVWHHQRSVGDLPTPHYIYYYIRGRLLFGQRHSNLSLDELEAGLAGFIDGWRRRIEQRAAGWLDAFDLLTATAIADGRAGRTGYRADIADVGGV